MKVFKFGGASVKNAEAIKNVASIISRYEGQKLAIVVSAMDKTTNKLELVVEACKHRDSAAFGQYIDEIEEFHRHILHELFSEVPFKASNEMDDLFAGLRKRIEEPFPENYSFAYDQIVSVGELLSSLLLSAYLTEVNHRVLWADARKLIRTNHRYQEGKVDWIKTQERMNDSFIPAFEHVDIQVTQGFIGHTAEGFTTTLGREGSDYTAGIIAYCCDAESVTIWKDVPGMLNADPKYFEDTILLDQISFKEAIELSYYGASVIHPKTIQPLQNKGIPLYVKSFVDPEAPGTAIQASTANDHLIPSFIIKRNQLLVSLTTRDFSFIAEENLSTIFDLLNQLKLTVNLMQNSALNFSFLLDRSKVDLDKLKSTFAESYELRYNEGLELLTIRHPSEEVIEKLTTGKEILVKQFTRQTARMVLKDTNGGAN
jgi:aspartate kinase